MLFTAWNMSIFGVFPVCIFPNLDLLCKSPYSVQMWKNTDQKNSKYGHFSRSVSLVCNNSCVEPMIRIYNNYDHLWISKNFPGFFQGRFRWKFCSTDKFSHSKLSNHNYCLPLKASLNLFKYNVEKRSNKFLKSCVWTSHKKFNHSELFPISQIHHNILKSIVICYYQS